MKRLVILLILANPFLLPAQREDMPINFKGNQLQFSVAKDESICLTSVVGDVAIANNINAKWSKPILPGLFSKGSALLSFPLFFNKDTGFITARYYAGDVHSFIYHTTNGGKSWDTINLHHQGEIREGYILDYGEAWLNTEQDIIIYTNNYGLNWRQLKMPVTDAKLNNIFFDKNKKGIIGYRKNEIALTKNNGHDWVFISTPLDQEKYRKTNLETIAEIDGVAIFKDYLIVSQEYMIFYSRMDSIAWVPVQGYNYFHTDPGNSALFFGTYEGKYAAVDTNMTIIQHFEVLNNGGDRQCKNGSLFIVGKNSVTRLTPGTGIETVSFFKNQRLPVRFNFDGFKSFGHIGDSIYTLEFDSTNWEYLLTLPLPFVNARKLSVNGSYISYETFGDSLFHFNLAGKLVKRTTQKNSIEDFLRPGIKKIIFEQGASGCFYTSGDQLIYENKITHFGNALEDTIVFSNRYKGMPQYKDEIDYADVNDFLNKLPELLDPNLKTTIQDLNFSDADYDRLRKDILKFIASNKKKELAGEKEFNFNINNLDYDRLLNLADSVKYLQPAKLKEFLKNLDGRISTSSTYKEITFINYEGERLYISTRYYGETPYCYPWYVSLPNYDNITTSAAIINFLQKVYPAFLQDHDKVGVLHSLVKHMY